jgi:alpha-L-arabinofuranosidase
MAVNHLGPKEIAMEHSPARIYVDTNRTIGDISPFLFGGFAEHMGRCIYGGIYDPASPHADERGLRRDVLAALREANYRIMRYPGGNFLSGYHWMDGVGPRTERPRRRDLAWKSIESNQFGVNEFIEFCRQINTVPMLGVNMGTGSIEEAAGLVEYCNGGAGSALADLRIAHGHQEPHNVQYWCVGNEMDGPWQIGHLDAAEYGLKAREAAKMMKWHDPGIKLILCGSSSNSMATYPEWDRVTLETCWEHVDYLSMHRYVGNPDNDTASYLGLTDDLEGQIDTLSGAMRYVKAKLRSNRDVYLSWDEWNVWYKARNMDGQWTEAPHLIEEVYNLEDSLLVAEWLSLFLRKCDVLKIACIAQIVNIIAPLLTTTDKLLKQSTFYPLVLFSRYASGVALDIMVQSPAYPTKRFGDLPALYASGSYDASTGKGAIFLVNRSQTEAIPAHIIWQSAAPGQISNVYQLAGDDPKAANSFDAPNVIVAKRLPALSVRDHEIELVLPPLSFTCLAE